MTKKTDKIMAHDLRDTVENMGKILEETQHLMAEGALHISAKANALFRELLKARCGLEVTDMPENSVYAHNSQHQLVILPAGTAYDDPEAVAKNGLEILRLVSRGVELDKVELSIAPRGAYLDGCIAAVEADIRAMTEAVVDTYKARDGTLQVSEVRALVWQDENPYDVRLVFYVHTGLKSA